MKMQSRRLLVPVMVFVAFMLMACASTVTPVYVLRHAEKEAGTDPVLAPAGQQRAQELARILNDVDVAAIYSTDYNRTRQTVEPLAAAKNLTVEIYADASAVAGTVMSQHEGDVVVIAGHSNTVPELITAFWGTKPYDLVPDKEFDNLFLLVVKKQQKLGGYSHSTKVLHMKYGADSSAP